MDQRTRGSCASATTDRSSATTTRSLTWDNPLRFDRLARRGPGQGREALWPNSNQNSGTVTGLLKLPARSQATAYVSLGDWSQNQTLIPFTVNTALASLAARPAHGRRQGTRDRDGVFVQHAGARTPGAERAIPFVRLRQPDAARSTSRRRSRTTPACRRSTPGTQYHLQLQPEDVRRRRVLDADRRTARSVPPTRATTSARRSGRSIRSDTDFARFSADAMGMKWVTLRGVYEYSRRVGQGLDDESLDDIGEQTSLRQFDISDQTTNRFSGIVARPAERQSVRQRDGVRRR